jgi:hypothetical protein
MRVKDLLEYDSDSPAGKQIMDILSDNGYELLGSGVDKSVWAKTEDNVVGILMPSSKKIDDAMKSFLVLYNLAKEFPNNKHLPRYVKFRDESGKESHYSEFTVAGRKFIQFGMERLISIDWNSDLMNVLYQVRNFAQFRHHMRWPEIWTRLCGMSKYLKSKEIKSRLEDVEISFKELYDTMKLIIDRGMAADLYIDRFENNIMMRKDGTPVIVDPYYYTSVNRPK